MRCEGVRSGWLGGRRGEATRSGPWHLPVAVPVPSPASQSAGFRAASAAGEGLGLSLRARSWSAGDVRLRLPPAALKLHGLPGPRDPGLQPWGPASACPAGAVGRSARGSSAAPPARGPGCRVPARRQGAARPVPGARPPRSSHSRPLLAADRALRLPRWKRGRTRASAWPP